MLLWRQKLNPSPPRELVGAHLFYSDVVREALLRRHAVHYFIYRDPRDVVVSEAYYLAHMNRWHRLHKHFKQLETPEARIRFAITGAEKQAPFYYPDIEERFARFRGWLDADETLCLRYESLISERQTALVHDIVRFYLKQTEQDCSENELVTTALKNIDPGKSHTFRKGESGSWQKTFTQEHKDLFKHYAGNLLVELGYETDLDW